MSEDSPRRELRLVATDDLERPRATVLFRLLLAIPHLLWLSLWSVVALVAAVALWVAVVVTGRAPSSLHAFLGSYVRYTAHVGAYLYLAAAPYPGFAGRPGYPVDLEIDPPSRQSRLGAAFRLVLAAPALLLAFPLGGTSGVGWSTTFVAPAGAAGTVAFLGWFACLARGRMPRGLRDLGAFCIGYGAQTLGYLLLLGSRYPNADPALVWPPQRLPEHPLRLHVDDGLDRSRLTVFFRLLLAVPHLLWLSLLGLVAILAVVPAWLAALLTGRVPSVLHRLLAAVTRYAVHVHAFLLLVGGPFPGFTGREGSYPVEALIAPAERQRRLVTLFRLVLVLPALLLAAALGGVLYVIGFLGWWASLVTGRMPAGLRDLGAACIRYNAQTSAYALLLTERYPYAAPALRDAPLEDALVPAAVGPDPGNLAAGATAEPPA